MDNQNQPIIPTENQMPIPAQEVMQPVEPLPQQPTPEVKKSSPSMGITIGVIIFILLVLAGVAYILFSPKKNTAQQSQQPPVTQPTQTSEQQPTPVVEIIDTSPELPENQKVRILVHHSDSTYNIYLVPLTSVGAYEQTLPQGDTVVKITNP